MSRWRFTLFGADGSHLSLACFTRAELIDAMETERDRPPVYVWQGTEPPPQNWHGTLAGPGISQTSVKPTRDEVFAALLPKAEGVMT